MRAKRIVIVAVIALLTLAVALGVSAQDYGGSGQPVTSGQPTTSGQTTSQQGFSGQTGQGNIGFNNFAASGQQAGLFPAADGTNFFVGLNGAMPRNATLLGVAFLDGFNTYTFDLNSLFNTRITPQAQPNVNANLNPPNQQQFALLQQCGDVRVYKLSPDGVQDLWPNVSCDGNLLTVQAGGRGHYILYDFNAAQNANNAPRALFPCTAQAAANVNFGQAAQTQAQSGNVTCVSAPFGTGTAAGQGTIQGNVMTATFVPVSNSGVSGNLSITPNGDNTQFSVTVNGLQPGTSYVSIYYENSTCALEPESAEEVIGGPYTANASGVGTTSGTADHPVDELHSVSVRLASNINVLFACASF